ncbi:DAR GTPase 3, chloroplastic [Porphyridium purpureum]|uniref:DAR GTPase 3, chloroplastic n=1 Tax=Porphyridium purpureum TaxID=35688 RepID=A0A5J4YT63_PORPP|nr:DAR GTPase 3, chloroplastic [Porphyridium purpureum]|eukprot:POR7532..scf229_5
MVAFASFVAQLGVPSGGGACSGCSNGLPFRVRVYSMCCAVRTSSARTAGPCRVGFEARRRLAAAARRPVVASASVSEQEVCLSEEEGEAWEDDGAMSQRPTTRKVKGELSKVGTFRPKINWYPGHIAKAERELRSKLGLVDVVLEVRDARIPLSTSHPSVEEWLGEKLQRVIVLNRVDMVSKHARAAWTEELQRESSSASAIGGTFCFVDSKKGDGVPALKRAILMLTSKVNEKRVRRGMLPRAIRCAVIGFPNVGKSALINRLVQKRAAKSENRPGVTRNLSWIRITKDIELLDSPGIIPMKLVDQDTALKLAYCNDIGEAAYDAESVAASLVDDLVELCKHTDRAFFDATQLTKRYNVDPFDEVLCREGGEVYVNEVAQRCFQGDRHRAGVAILNDFRSGRLGAVTLEVPNSYLT